MFTGLIETLGEIRRVVHHGAGVGLWIATQPELVRELVLGESVSVDGACLTVTHASSSVFQVDATAETLNCTTLAAVQLGRRVHLERALPLGGRLGGHLVTGHVDGVGHLRQRKQQGRALVLFFDAPPQVLKYLVVKGSIAIDGVSLTVNGVGATGFDIVLIPHTQRVVHLQEKSVGTPVNLEVDIMGKYAERLQTQTKHEQASRVDLKLLRKAGFIP